MALLVLAGERCERLMDQRIRKIHARHIQADEIWTYVGKKERRLTSEDDEQRMGDQYTFVALDADSKLVISYLVGKRDGNNTLRFIRDLSERITGRPQISTDGWQPYTGAIEEYFGADVDYAQVVKVYGSALPGAEGGRDWYRPVRVMGAIRTPMAGDPVASQQIRNSR